MEYLAYFLTDCEYARMLWDPLFLHAKELERVDSNNSVYHLVYKPISILEFPWYISFDMFISSTIQSYPRDFCLHRHISYDEDLNCYFIMFSSTTYPSCKPSPSVVRGEMRILMFFGKIAQS